MKVLFVASEAAPFAKTGGLGDVAGSLSPAIAGLGHDVRVVIPRYRSVDADAARLRHLLSFSVPVASWNERCDIYESGLTRDVHAYFVGKSVYFDRPGLYGTAREDYPDNAERFIFFSRAVLELCRRTGFRPDIIHCNDWQTGLVPLYLRKLYANDPVLGRTATVLTIHNLGYQGLFWHGDMKLTGLGWDVFTPEGIEFWGKINFLKAGIVFADALTTVSRTYSREIQTPEHGYGLDGLLARRSSVLHGIVNGIDDGLWDPSRDTALPRTFSAARPEGKAACTAALREQAGLLPSNGPVIAMVSRIAEQKGFDIMTQALPDLLALGAQIVVLGTGDETYGKMLADAERRHPGRVRLLSRFDETLARLVYAGSDLFLMPSRYEPCGLGQMIAQRYGSVPVVRRTGGLADTVADHDPATGKGTGFLFVEYSAAALAACVKRALEVFRDRKAWTALMRAGMKRDFSWKRSAQEYAAVYRMAVQGKAPARGSRVRGKTPK